jgi:hypothetical protein
MMSVYYLRRALFDQQPRAWWWAGCAAAAALLSKQVAIALPLMLLLYILLDKQRYHYLKREFCWFVLPIGLASVPLVLWNYQHDWVMFGHSQSHFTQNDKVSWSASLASVVDILFFQILLITPLIASLVLLMSVQNCFKFRIIPAEQQFLMLLGPVLLLGVILLSFKQKVQGNWPMPFYFTALILLAGYWQAGRWKKTQQYALSLGLVLVLVTYLLPSVLQIFQLQDSKLNPIKRFRHWQVLATNIQTQREQAMPKQDAGFVLALGHRNLASEMAFYLPDHPKVFRYEDDGAVVSQYELWPNPMQVFPGGDALVISDAGQAIPDKIQQAFQRFQFIAEVANPKQANAPYYLYRGEHLLRWPVPDSASRF